MQSEKKSLGGILAPRDKAEDKEQQQQQQQQQGEAKAAAAAAAAADKKITTEHSPAISGTDGSFLITV